MPQARDRGKVLLSAPKLPQFKGAAAKTGVPPEGNILLYLRLNYHNLSLIHHSLSLNYWLGVAAGTAQGAYKSKKHILSLNY